MVRLSSARDGGGAKRSRRDKVVRLAPYVTISGLLIVVVPLTPPFVQTIAAKALIFAIFAMSLDLLYGYTALFSLGHAAYFGTAAYTVGLLWLRGGIDNFWITAPVAVLAATLLAALFGLVAVRFADIYFLVITFALGMLMFALFHQVHWMKSPGLEGIASIPRPDFMLFDIKWSITNFYFLVFVVFVILFILLRRIIRSPFGQSLMGIRENEQRMKTLGYNTWLYKYLAFIIGGVIAGVGGVLYAWDRGFVAAEVAGVHFSFLAMIMVIIGGPGTLWGPALGAGMLIAVEQYISFLVPARWPLILGALFIVTVLLFRGGIAPHLTRLARRASGRWEPLTAPESAPPRVSTRALE